MNNNNIADITAEAVLMRFKFYSDTTDISHIDIPVDIDLINKGSEALEEHCLDCIKNQITYQTLVPYTLRLVEAAPEHEEYKDLVVKCFEDFQLVFVAAPTAE